MFNFLKNLRTQTQQQPDWQTNAEDKQTQTADTSPEPTELELLEKERNKLIREYVNVCNDCEVEICRQVREESSKYPIAQLDNYSRQISALYFKEVDKRWKAIQNEYKEEREKADAEANMYRDQYEMMEWCEEKEKLHKLHDDACDRSIAISKLIRKLCDEVEADCQKKYPYEMLNTVVNTLKHDFADVKETIKERVASEYKDRIKEVEIQRSILEVKIDRIKNPEFIENDSQQPT